MKIKKLVVFVETEDKKTRQVVLDKGQRQTVEHVISLMCNPIKLIDEDLPINLKKNTL